MTIEQIEKKLNLKVKITFKEYDQRFPVIGKFVETKDAEYLKSKGMYRFVPQSKLEYWTGVEEALTKIFIVKDIVSLFEVKQDEVKSEINFPDSCV